MMGSASDILHMISIIVIMILMPISLQTTHIFAGASLDFLAQATDFNVHGVHQLYDENQIRRISEKDENEEKEPFMLQRFKALLGLESFTNGYKENGDFERVSPAPSPSGEDPAPAPAQPVHRHPHPFPSRTVPNPPPHLNKKKQRENAGVKGTLVAALSGGGAAFVVCALGAFWACRRLAKQRKKFPRKMFPYSKKRGGKHRSKYLTSQCSAGKVSTNPGLDLFYLDALGIDLEQQHSCLRQTSANSSTSSQEIPQNSTLNLRKEYNHDLVKAETDIVSSSSTREIMSVHEDEVPVQFEPEAENSSAGDRVVPFDSSASDDESFHSFGDCQSSNIRLSNASAGSLSDTSEKFPIDEPKLSPPQHPKGVPVVITSSGHNSNLITETPESPLCLKPENSIDIHPSECQKTSTVPPPPPPLPPPPPPFSRLSPLYSSRSSRVATRSSSILQQLYPSMDSISSSVVETSPNIHLPSSPQSSQTPTVSPNIPPPPCPPPFPRKNNSFSKGPPPPPSPPSLFPTMGKGGSPLPKLKPLHWDKVRATPDRTMVWDKLRSSSFELDEEMIESLFGYNMQCSMKNDDGRNKTPSPSKHVLDQKRLQNITILLKALNASAEQVSAALVRGNGLCLQQLEALVKMVPTKEEEAKLSNYAGNITELGPAEQFVKTLLCVPFAFPKIESMLFRETFEDEVVHLKNSFSMLEEACKELRSSRLFLKLLEAVLKTGNRMNVGTIRGGAKAFKLDALLKLADVKGTDGKTTLLHFVVQEIIRSEGIRVSDSIMGKISQRSNRKTIEEKEEDYRRMGLDLVSGLSHELYHVKKTATVDLDVLANSVSNLSNGMIKSRHLVDKDLTADEKNKNFVNPMRCFLKYAEKSLKELQEDENKVLLHVRDITEYFHGDVSKDDANPLRIFVIVRDFLAMLDHVCKELRSFKAPVSPNPLAPFR